MTTARDDQIQAAIRDAGAWVDTNEATTGYMDLSDAPHGYAELTRRFRASQPESHVPCEHLRSSGPQVVHWFAEMPGRAWCNDCGFRKMWRLRKKRRPCLGCGIAAPAVSAEATTGNVVVHGALCDHCGQIPA